MYVMGNCVIFNSIVCVDVCNFMWKIEDQVVLLKCHIAEAVQVWNSRSVRLIFFLSCFFIREQHNTLKQVFWISPVKFFFSINRIQEFISARKKEQKLQAKMSHQVSRTSEVFLCLVSFCRNSWKRIGKMF